MDLEKKKTNIVDVFIERCGKPYRAFENARGGGGRSKGLAERQCETPERRLQKRKGLMCIYGIIKLIVSSNEENRKKIYM